jgi:selenocysteine-specific elongation factor
VDFHLRQERDIMADSSHIIVGTAGHVDHGKTELTAVLTGINTDRLPEEKKRGMTIVPGFVPLTLPNGLRLGLIDVPGHERFVKNMLAGVAGIDMVMLVIAADEGVMPQTVEHLHILHLLGISKGVAVITKADLVDEEWLELIKEQVTDLLAKTSLAGAPIVVTSAYTGQGLDELKQELMRLAATVEVKPLSGHARLPIDRVFSKTGFGTVVTGTLWSGSLREGQKVELWPAGREARIRSLQVHNEKVEQAMAGQRTAVNLSGVEAVLAPRGGWLAEPGLLRESHRLDIELRLLDTAKALSQRSRLRVHHGTTEALARVNFLDREELLPGASCFAQLELESPLPPLAGDKLVLRSYSPMHTLGGATVLDPRPARHKRYHPEVIAALTARTQGSGSDLLAATLAREAKPLALAAAAAAAQTPGEEIAPRLAELTEAGRLLRLVIDGEQQWLAAEVAASKLVTLAKLLAEYHEKYPLRAGYPLAELRGKLFAGFTVKQLNALLEQWQSEVKLVAQGALLALADFKPQPSDKQQEQLTSLTRAYGEQLFGPPVWEELTAELRIPAPEAAELLQYLLEQGRLIRGGEFYFSSAAPAEAWKRLKAAETEAGFAAGDIRELLATNRKYTLSLLEYMDGHKLTLRKGERRFCGKGE